MSTLSYATKVTKIQNEPIKNDDPRWKVIQELKVPLSFGELFK